MVCTEAFATRSPLYDLGCAISPLPRLPRALSYGSTTTHHSTNMLPRRSRFDLGAASDKGYQRREGQTWTEQVRVFLTLDTPLTGLPAASIGEEMRRE